MEEGWTFTSQATKKPPVGSADTEKKKAVWSASSKCGPTGAPAPSRIWPRSDEPWTQTTTERSGPSAASLAPHGSTQAGLSSRGGASSASAGEKARSLSAPSSRQELRKPPSGPAASAGTMPSFGKEPVRAIRISGPAVSDWAARGAEDARHRMASSARVQQLGLMLPPYIGLVLRASSLCGFDMDCPEGFSEDRSRQGAAQFLTRCGIAS